MWNRSDRQRSEAKHFSSNVGIFITNVRRTIIAALCAFLDAIYRARRTAGPAARAPSFSPNGVSGQKRLRDCDVAKSSPFLASEMRSRSLAERERSFARDVRHDAAAAVMAASRNAACPFILNLNTAHSRHAARIRQRYNAKRIDNNRRRDGAGRSEACYLSLKLLSSAETRTFGSD